MTVSKKIAVFSDGTANSVGGNDSNVLRLCKMLDLGEDGGQIAIYDPGIGTDVGFNRLSASLSLSPRMLLADSNSNSQLLRKSRRPLELGFGLGAAANIKQLYLALVQHYEPGDGIYLFGFSRGAFTVRALAGLIYRCGLLRRGEESRVGTAMHWYKEHYTAFKSIDARSRYRSCVDAFRREVSRPCDIRFLGVWDTVKSVGYVRPKNLPHTRHNPIVQTVRHALALDERRSFYQHTTWGGLDGDTRRAVHAPASFDLDETDDPPGKPQDVEEVWFPGNHSDVGGGYPPSESAPANNSLRWMSAAARDCALRIRADAYVATFARDQDEPPLHRHDEMAGNRFARAGWWLADRAPRWELHNEPPPPKTEFCRRPTGPRALAPTARCGVVSVHASAQGVYPEATAPWRDVPVRFVPTAIKGGG